jgi:hypothetical protein
LAEQGGVDVTQPGTPPELVVRPDPDSRLGQLLAQFDIMDSQLKEMDKQVKALKAAYKAELTAITQANGTPYARYVVRSPDGMAYVLKWQPTTSVPVADLKAKYPHIHAELSKQGGTWKWERA